MPVFNIRFLEDSETCLAQQLIYEIYVEIGGWMPLEGPAFKFNEEEQDECRLLYLEYGRVECDGPAGKCCELVDRIVAKEARVKASSLVNRPARSFRPTPSAASKQDSPSRRPQEACSV